MSGEPRIAEPLRCQKCGAPVPLLGASSFECPYCRATVKVSKSYQELFEKNRLEADARRELQTRYAHISSAPSRRFDTLALALVILGPAIAAMTYMALVPAIVSPAVLFAVAILPALLPGTVLWMWSASVHATVVRYQLALAARAPKTDGAAPGCRQCGAPLEADDDAIFARCAYCGTDSLVTQIVSALTRLDEALRKELKTIKQAITALLYRRRLLVGGIAIAVLVLAGLAFVLFASLK